MEIRREQAMKSGLFAGITGASLVAVIILTALGCGGGGSGPAKLLVTASAGNNVPGFGTYFLVYVQQGGTPVDNAVVTITVGAGTPQLIDITLIPGTYARLTNPTMNVGDDVTLTVTHDGLTATCTRKMPAQPTVGNPAESSSVDATADTSVTWSGIGTPDIGLGIRAEVAGAYTQSTAPWIGTAVPLYQTFITLPANTLKLNQSTVELQLNTFCGTFVLGDDAETGSYFETANYSVIRTFSTSP
jgi:hypothetical protein